MNGFSEVYLFRDTKILKNKNFKVDDLDEYLFSEDKCINNYDDAHQRYTPIETQLLKNGLKIKLVLNMDGTGFGGAISMRHIQSMLSYRSIYNINYAKIIVCDRLTASNIVRNTPAYYFITGKKWTAYNSIEFEMEMDVINTLLDNDGSGTPLALSSKTTILREHKNRFESRAGAGIEWVFPLIDRYSENINVPLYKTREETLRESTIFSEPFKLVDLNFFLIYKARENPETNPETAVDILLCCDEKIYAKGGTTGYTGSRNPKTDLRLTQEWLIYGADSNNIGASITFTAKSGTHKLTITASNQCLYISQKYIALLVINDYPTIPTTMEEYKPKSKFTSVYFESVFYVRKGAEPIADIHTSTITTIPQDTSFPTTTTQNTPIGTIYDIDRTDPKLLKVIKLPYKPIESSWHLVNDGSDNLYFGITLPAGWGVLSGSPNLIKMENTNVIECLKSGFLGLDSDTEGYGFDPLYPLRMKRFPTRSEKVLKESVHFEPKLYHSDFYQEKFVYDSFAFTFKLENYRCGANRIGGVQFLVSSTMNSKMAFRFQDSEFIGSDLTDNGLVFDAQDYSNILYIARNNELPLFNSAYLQYIRTGYNYDIKTKNRQLANSIVSGTAQTIGAVVSAVAGGPLGIAGAVGLGISAFSKLYGAVSNNAQAEQNIAQKLKSTEMQGLSVIGSDDVDIMSEYTENNKAKDVIYEASPKMKQCLYDLFFYCGYVANYQGVPEYRTRMWFNFIMADPVYEYEQAFPQDLLDELTKKFKEGITFLHKNVYSDIPEWDFEQKYENWELSW